MNVPLALEEPFHNYEESADTIHDLRMVVYAAESLLEDAKDALAFEEARCVLEAEGRNAEERKANATRLSYEDARCHEARQAVSKARWELAQAQANLEREIDRKRSWGWLIRSIGGINAPSVDES